MIAGRSKKNKRASQLATTSKSSLTSGSSGSKSQGMAIRFSLLAFSLIIFSAFYLLDVKPTVAVAASEKASLKYVSITSLLADLYAKVQLPMLGTKLPKKSSIDSSVLPTKGDVPDVFRFDGLPLLERRLVSAASLSGSSLKQGFVIENDGQRYGLSLDPDLQKAAEKILRENNVMYGAIVAIVPQTGRVVTLASQAKGRSSDYNVALEASYPAASLFKLITAAAAIESAGLSEGSTIHFHGGDHTLNKLNYLPDFRKDQRQMTLEAAFGKSVNPAFARLGVGTLSPSLLSSYAESFGFNKDLTFELPPNGSRFNTPDDEFEMAMTAAGFQNAKLSPLHAAMLAATVANDGVMMKPYLIDSVEGMDGIAIYRSSPKSLGRAVLSSTASTLTNIMKNTVTHGTARRHFGRSRSLQNMSIAGKTGTLSGENPKGRYFWFIAHAPADNPKIAIATLVIDQGTARTNGVGMGRIFLEHFFSQSPKG